MPLSTSAAPKSAVGLEVPAFHAEWDGSVRLLPYAASVALWRLSGPFESLVWWHTTLTVWDTDGSVDPEADEVPSSDLRDKLTFTDLSYAAGSLHPTACTLTWDTVTLTLEVTETDGARRLLVAHPLSAGQVHLAAALLDAQRRTGVSDDTATCAADDAAEFTDTVARIAGDLLRASASHRVSGDPAPADDTPDHLDYPDDGYEEVLDLVREVDAHRTVLEALSGRERLALLNLAESWNGTMPELVDVACDLGLLPR